MSRLLAAAVTALLATTPAAASVPSPTTAFTVHAREITEASGIARSIRTPGVFYVHNDSGDTARFFAVDAHTGRLRTTFHVSGAVNHDWEDLAVARAADGAPSVWLADIGDNDAVRSQVQLYRVPEQKVTRGAVETARPMLWRLRYPTGPVNAESLFVDPRGRAYLVTKTTSGHSEVYAVPPRPDAHRVQQLRRIGSIALQGSRTLLGGAAVQTSRRRDVEGRQRPRRANVRRRVLVARPFRPRRGSAAQPSQDRGSAAATPGRGHLYRRRLDVPRLGRAGPTRLARAIARPVPRADFSGATGREKTVAQAERVRDRVRDVGARAGRRRRSAPGGGSPRRASDISEPSTGMMPV